MNTALWIVAALLAATFLVAGAAKLATPKEKLAASPNMAWSHDFSPSAIKAIGAVEVAAAIGLVMPGAVDIVPGLVPLASVSLVLLMVGAAVTHARRNEPRAITANLALIALAVFVAWGRLGPHSFS